MCAIGALEIVDLKFSVGMDDLGMPFGNPIVAQCDVAGGVPPHERLRFVQREHLSRRFAVEHPQPLHESFLLAGL